MMMIISVFYLMYQNKHNSEFVFLLQEVARLLFTDTFSAKSTISAQNIVPQTVGE